MAKSLIDRVADMVMERLMGQSEDAPQQPRKRLGTEWNGESTKSAPESANGQQTVSRRVYRNPGPRVVYVLTPKAKAAMKRKTWDPSAEMFHTQAQTFAALAKAKKPVTAKQLESLTKLGRKTIESCVYHLRQDGWIVSEAKS